MSSFRWRDDPAHDDADAADDRLIASHVNGASEVRPQQPLGELLPAYKNLVSQQWQIADAQRRRAARAEARLAQLRGDLMWIALALGPGCFALGWFLAWTWTWWRR
jgi:hypothetical protein